MYNGYTALLLGLLVLAFGAPNRPLEKSLLDEWAINQTKTTEVLEAPNWSVDVDYCDWDGFTCNEEFLLTGIKFTCPVTFYGLFPPLQSWRDNQRSGAFLFLTSIEFTDCNMGPWEPAPRFWGLPPFNFSLVATSGRTPSIACPLSDYAPASVSCSSFRVIQGGPASAEAMNPSGDPGSFAFVVNTVSGWINPSIVITLPNGTQLFPAILNVITDPDDDFQTFFITATPPGEGACTVDVAVGGVIVTSYPLAPYGWGCPPGLFHTGVLYECDPCPVGTFKPEFGTTCTDATLGNYVSTLGATSQTTCPPGTTTAAEASTSLNDCNVACAPGEFSMDGACTICPNSTYSAAGSGTCTPCPFGRNSPAGSGSVDDCVVCPAGTIGTEEGCTPCPTPTFSLVAGSPACYECPEGYFSAPTGLRCIKCPAGQYRPAGLLVNCTDCPEGQYSPNDGSAFCSLCPTGSITYGATKQATCYSCPDGFTTLHPGSTFCTNAPTGQRTDSSFVAGIVLTIVGSLMIIFVILASIYLFGVYFPAQKRELEGIANQMTELAKQST